MVDDTAMAELACAEVERVIAAVDSSCSRFRPDSELLALNAHFAGESTRRSGFVASPMLFDAVAHAVRAAELTNGVVDPTLGRALRSLGYDQDFLSVPPDGPPIAVSIRRNYDWTSIYLDSDTRTIGLPSGVEIDLGATAKAWCSDLSAQAASEAIGSGVLVSLGGDIAVWGTPPTGGWTILVGDDHASSLDEPGDDVSIVSGGLATSSTTVRHWRRGNQELHHVIDPATGEPALVAWRTVSVAAVTCLDANIATTAAIILGVDAVDWLGERGLPARLVDLAGNVTVLAGWPSAIESGTS